ncbi:DUF4232 domain-containing protein [Streptomyces catenulae]|uniref:DUF4232 domain-containing protein n=1 Tax=Streptomyces catenulae TaxID=66875 RepID=A0ABV2Z1T1_9ACTN|nr:DUF4232 domain-containing protein [Streptomyces catenulae]
MPFRLRRSFALVAVVGATVFATTACDADGDATAVQSGDAGSPTAGSPAGSPAGTPSASDDGQATSSGAGQGGESGKEVGDACTTEKVQVEFADAGGTRPAVLLKATNISDTACTAYGLPVVGHPAAKTPLTTAPGTDAHATVALDPGETAYAALLLPEKGAHPHTTTSFTLGLRDKDGDPLDGTATLKAPGEGLTVNDASRVTAWQANQEDALG